MNAENEQDWNMKMSRKKTIILVVAFLVTMLIIAVVLLLINNRFTMDNYRNCSISYWDDGTLIEKEINDTDGEKIHTILNNKIMFHENLSCGFGEESAIYFNDKDVSIYISQDECGYLYSVNDKKYIAISDDEMQTIVNILWKYSMMVDWQRYR